MSQHIFLFAPYSGQFSSSFAHSGGQTVPALWAAVPPRRALARPGGFQMSWNAGNVGGGIQKDSHYEVWGMQCMVLG